MRFASLTALVDRVFAWADGVQRRYGVLGFPYAVVKKYGDDDGGREAALITYYGFLSIFPLLLLGVAILSRVLTANPELQQRLIDEIVPPVLRSTVEQSVTTLPTSTVPFIAGLIGLLFSGTGVVLLGARLLLSRPSPLRALWPSAALGAAAVTLVLSVGSPLLAELVSRAG